MTEPTQAQTDAGVAFIKAKANASPFGHLLHGVPDDKFREFVKEFAEVILNAAPKPA